MHKRKTILLVIRAGFDSKLQGFVTDLNTLIIFTGCALLLVPGGQKTSSSLLTSMFLYSENVPGVA